MDQPITLWDILMADTLYTLGCLIVLLIVAILGGVSNLYDRWKAKQPDWENDWD